MMKRPEDTGYVSYVDIGGKMLVLGSRCTNITQLRWLREAAIVASHLVSIS